MKRAGLLIAFVLFGAVVGVLPTAAMTEHCMLDGDDVRETFFAAPTKDTTPVRIVMAGYTYSIPRNYFRFPQVECRTGETRGVVLRMTLPDFLPATNATWDQLYGSVLNKDASDIQVSVSQQTLKDMGRLMDNRSRVEVQGRAVPPVKNLESFARGPIAPTGYHIADVYFRPSRDRPDLIIDCSPLGKSDNPICTFLFEHNGLVWSPWMRRKYLLDWREIITGLKTKIDSFIVRQ
ncbi:MAG TPA: hypothetical protein VHG27_02180 [Xanthobacteraceae bacterium]|nr:hypothetical protein [Xanthobacteraceae bacterium]